MPKVESNGCEKGEEEGRKKRLATSLPRCPLRRRGGLFQMARDTHNMMRWKNACHRPRGAFQEGMGNAFLHSCASYTQGKHLDRLQVSGNAYLFPLAGLRHG